MSDICRLCRKPSPLQRSHILPEFLYRPLYDEKHRISVVKVEDDRIRYLQKGLTEALLCFACEQKLGRCEKYAAEVMTGRLGHRFQRNRSRLLTEGIDYHRFKLFQMSILWRASISSLEFFRLVSLGPREEILRTMLVHEQPGRPDQFGCVVVCATDKGSDISDTFFNPEPFRWSGHRMTKLFFAGAGWLFHCDHRTAPAYLQELFLQLDGTLQCLFGDLADARAYGGNAKRVARMLGV
jgi:hypothetical protein